MLHEKNLKKKLKSKEKMQPLKFICSKIAKFRLG